MALGCRSVSLGARSALRGRAVAARRARRAAMGTTASRALFSPPNVKTSTETLADFKAKDIDGNEVELSKYKGNVVLMVNVASA